MMLETLLKYTAAADRKMIEVFRQNVLCSDRSVLLFSHILDAQHIWISRILGKAPLYERLQLHSPDKFSEISGQNTAAMQLILGELHLEQEIHYSNSDGSPFVNTVGEILYHSVNHSTYHRGQVAAEFRQNGITPPVTDLIVFLRRGEL